MKTQPINQNITLFRGAGAQGVSQKCTQKGVQRGVNAETTWKREHSSPPAKAKKSGERFNNLVGIFAIIIMFALIGQSTIQTQNPDNMNDEQRLQMAYHEGILTPPPKDLQLEPVDKI